MNGYAIFILCLVSLIFGYGLGIDGIEDECKQCQKIWRKK